MDTPHQMEHDNSSDVRARIIAAASRLISEGGRDALTTRAVASAAMVQVPTIYRLFNDKRGLENAVAEDSIRKYISKKLTHDAHPDPVKDLRDGWDVHVAFGLAHPDLFALMNAEPNQPAVLAGLEVLRRRINRLALAGRLRVSEEMAVSLMQAVCNGTVLALLAQPEDARDPDLAPTAREAVLAAITTVEAADEPVVAAATTLRAALPQAASLTFNEQNMMAEWLDRMAKSGDH